MHDYQKYIRMIIHVSMPKNEKSAVPGSSRTFLIYFNTTCRIMCCLCLGPGLLKIDGRTVTRNQRELVALLDRPALRIALSQVSLVISISKRARMRSDIRLFRRPLLGSLRSPTHQNQVVHFGLFLM
jgi:hypothetical protein